MRPVAGVTIASLSVVVIRGAKNPLVVEVRSSRAVAAGLVVPMPTLPVLPTKSLVLVSVVPPVRNFKVPDSVACIITSPVPADWITVALALDKVKSVEAEVDLIPGLEALISRLPSTLIYGMTDVPVPGGSP